MIHQLRIRAWRAYRNATIDLSGSLVFFVAPNGVGKSSLYEAAHHCLLGFPSGKNAARGISDDDTGAALSMDLTIAGHSITVTRTITRSGQTTFEAVSDGVSLDENAFLDLMTKSWSADRALLDRLVFGDLDQLGRPKAALPIREHLAALMGVTPLIETAGALRNARNRARKTVTGIREDVSGSQDAIANAMSAFEADERALDEAAAKHAEVSTRITFAQAEAAVADAWEEYRLAIDVHNAKVTTLLTEIGQQISIDPVDPVGGLDTARRSTEADLLAARDARTAAEVAAARIIAATDILRGPVDRCPTCLRPLTESERFSALQSHGSTSSSTDAENHKARAAIDKEEHRLRVIDEFTRRLDRLTPPSRPTNEDPGSGAKARLVELQAVYQALTERLGEARAHRDTSRASLSRERANLDDAALLNRAAREELLLDATADILEGVANKYLVERIEPLSRDIAHRWKLLVGQEGLTVGPSGEITLRRGSVDLELDDMSGGERAIAGIVVRLLVAASVTRIPVVWFDEPLEHLDPRRRAGIAQVLVGAVAAGTIDQVIVATYEEPLVRRLALAAPDLVTVVYADSGTGPTD